MAGLARSLGIGIDWQVDNQGLLKANAETNGLINKSDRLENEMNQAGIAGSRAGRKIADGFRKVKTHITTGLDALKRYRYQLTALGATGAAGIFKLSSMAGDAVETVNRFEVVFKSLSQETKEWARGFNENIAGDSFYGVLDVLAGFQNALVPLGFARKEAQELSKEMITLAADFGSFYDVGTSNAANLMQSALIGNHRAVKSLGVQLNESTLQLAAQRQGIKENFAELDLATKIQLRFNEMIRQSQDVIGDAERTLQEHNRQQTKFKGNLRDTAIALSNAFIPTMTKGYGIANDFLDAFKESEWVAPTARILGLTTAFAGLAGGIGIVYALAGAVGIGAAPIAGILAGIGAVILVVEDLWAGFQGGESYIFNIINWFKNLTGESTVVADSIDWLSDKFELMKEDLSLLAGGLIDTFAGFGELIVGILTFDKEKIVNGFKTMISGIDDLFWGLTDSLLHTSTAIGEGVSKSIIWGIKSLASGFVTVGSNILNSIWFGIETGWDSFMNWWSENTQLSFDVEWPDIQGFINDQVEKLPNWSKKLLGIDTTVIEKESSNISKSNKTEVNNNNSQNNEVTINIQGANDPEAVGKEVEKKLNSYIQMQAGEVGAN